MKIKKELSLMILLNRFLLIVTIIILCLNNLSGTNRTITTHLDITDDELNALLKLELSEFSYHWDIEHPTEGLFSIDITLTEPQIEMNAELNELRLYTQIILNLESSKYPYLIEELESAFNSNNLTFISLPIIVPTITIDIETLALEVSNAMSTINGYCELLPSLILEIEEITNISIGTESLENLCDLLIVYFDSINLNIALDNIIDELSSYIPDNINIDIEQINLMNSITNNSIRLSLNIETNASFPTVTVHIRRNLLSEYILRFNSTITTSITDIGGGYISTGPTFINIVEGVGTELIGDEETLLPPTLISSGATQIVATFYFQSPYGGWFSRSYSQYLGGLLEDSDWVELDLTDEEN